MPIEQQKRIAYELTVEYVRQNKVLEGDLKSIPQQITLIEEIYNTIYKNLANKNIL